jgi:protein-tyrosine phosphatase
MAGYLDLHSHVLPGLDDGARELDEGLSMLQGLEALGFSEVFATPHQRAGMFLPTREAIDAARASLEGSRAQAGIPVALRLAAENMWDDVFHSRIPDHSFPRYDGGPAFLVEVQPAQLPPHLEDQLFQFRTKGLLPVLAHPERYVPLWKDAERVERLGQICALVVDLGALDGAHGRPQAKLARRLVEDGLAHAAASDCHSVADLGAAAAGIAWIKKRIGAEGASRLLRDNPRRIIAGDLPDRP